MMIRTLIEITSETPYDHDRNLKAVLDKLGFEPKRTADQIKWEIDLVRGLVDRGIQPNEVVEAFRAKFEVAP